MAQRTMNARLAAAHETRQQLEEETPSCRSCSPSSGRERFEFTLPFPDGRGHRSLEGHPRLQQQQTMMAAQLTALNNLVEASSSSRHRPADVRSFGHQPSAPMSRPWKLDMPTLQAPEDTDLSFFADWWTRWTDYVALTRVMDDVRTPAARQGLLRSALHPDRSGQCYGRRGDWTSHRMTTSTASSTKSAVTFVSAATLCSTARISSVATKRKARTLTSTSHPSSASTTDARWPTRTIFRPAALNVDMQGITVAASKSVASVTGSSLVSVTPACSGEYCLKTLARTSHWIACCRSARPTNHQRTQA